METMPGKLAMPGFICVAAVGPNGQIGSGNDLPWSPNFIKGDMNFFKQITMSLVGFDKELSVTPAPDNGNVVIMGRKTWESIPPKYRPLNNRHNIVITSRPDPIDGYSHPLIFLSNILALLWQLLSKRP